MTDAFNGKADSILLRLEELEWVTALNAQKDVEQAYDEELEVETA